MMLQISKVENEQDLQAAFALRNRVFVQEQGVPEDLELDDHDHTDATHFMAKEQGTIVATARILTLGNAWKVQRVAVEQVKRGTGLGKLLMLHLIEQAKDENGITQLVLGAQTDAQVFYEKLGFIAEGPVFDDAGIPHRTMRYTL